MTRAEFLTIFQKHLRVGEPKRAELLAEINHHLDEADSADDLGNPKHLAHKMNLVHVGWFGYPLAIPLCAAGWMALCLLSGSWISWLGLTAENLHMIPGGYFWWALNNAIEFLIPAAVALMVGKKLAQLNRPGRYLTILISTVFTIVFVYAAVMLPREPGNDAAWVLWLAGFEIGFLVTTYLTILALFSFLHFLPRKALSGKRRKAGVIFELLLAFAYAFAGYLAIMFFVEFFAPYNGWLTETRPAHQYIARQINDFFEHGPGLIIAYGAFFILLVKSTVNKIKKIRQSI